MDDSIHTTSNQLLRLLLYALNFHLDLLQDYVESDSVEFVCLTKPDCVREAKNLPGICFGCVVTYEENGTKFSKGNEPVFS